MKKFILIIFSLLLIGCGTDVVLEKSPVKNLKINFSAKRVLILPFEDFTSKGIDNIWLQTNLLLYNSIADQFIIHNIFPVPLNDIIAPLIKNKDINIGNRYPTLINELKDPAWSNEMRKEILNTIKVENVKMQINKNFIHFSKKEIFKLANKFNADYIVKSEIIDFKITQQNTYNPLKIGLLNSPGKFFSKMLFGNPDSTNWGIGQTIFTTSSIAGIIGYNIDTPFGPGHSKTIISGHPLFGKKEVIKTGGDSDYNFKNALFWGMSTGIATLLASHGGNIPKIDFGIRIYILEVKTRKMIWTNSVNLHVIPESMFFIESNYNLISKAIEKSIDEIFKSFWKANPKGIISLK